MVTKIQRVLFCEECGTPHQVGAHFCSNCGKALDDDIIEGCLDDIVVIKPRIRTSLPRFVMDQLQSDEVVLAAYSASIFDHHRTGNLRHDKVMLTTERIISYRTSILHKSMNQISYRMVTGVHYNRGLFHGKVIVQGANFGLTLDRISNQDAAFAERVIAAAIAGQTFDFA